MSDPSKLPTTLAVFAKHWTPGNVKTRLAATLGEERAAEVAQRLLRTVTRRFDANCDRPVIVFTPADARNEFTDIVGDDWSLTPQSAGDLGERMEHFFQEANNDGSNRVVAIGADSPDLPKSVIDDAFTALERMDLVLGPTIDGGYYLVGTRIGAPPIFDRMPWSEATLWQATIARLETLGWRQGREYEVLPEWYDVDTMDDLNRLRGELLRTDDCHLKSLRRDLETLLPAFPLP